MVWIEEINQHIVLTLRNNLSVLDEQGNPSSITVSYERPEGEGRLDIQDDLPKVVIRLYDMFLDRSRVGTNQGLKQVVEENDDTITVKDYPIPYWLFYEITIFSEYTQDALSLLTQIQTNIPVRGHIYVPGGDTEETTPLFMEMIAFENPREAQPDKSGAERRLLRRSMSRIRYRLTAELPVGALEEYYKTKEVEVESIVKGGDTE